MSIDYDKLRTELEETEAGVHVTTRYTWADLAHELLRLRRELVDLRDEYAPHVPQAPAHAAFHHPTTTR